MVAFASDPRGMMRVVWGVTEVPLFLFFAVTVSVAGIERIR